MNALAASRIETQSLAIGYAVHRGAPKVVASGIGVRIAAGELVCVLGPNGAGKSTLLRTLAGLQAPLAGRVLLDGVSVHAIPPRQRARALSVVLTDRVSAGLLDVYSLVSLGRSPYTDWAGTLTPHDHDVVQAALRSVDAEPFATRRVVELSDGERQRVVLARALAQQPRLLVLDEITAFLDLPRRVEIMRLLRRLARDTQTAILLSTHDLELALRTADRIWLMPKDGSTLVGSPEQLVLSGAFEGAFRSEGVEFDAATGMFRLHREPHGDVEVIGDSLHAIWTGRALERHGYRLRPAGSGSAMTVIVDGSAPTWTLARDGMETAFDSVDALVTACVPGNGVR